MSSMDLYEDGFPHSTREGYDRGCRGSACPGKLENGFSCADAVTRWNGDYQFRKNVQAGMSPAEIAVVDAAEAAAAANRQSPTSMRVIVNGVERPDLLVERVVSAADMGLVTAAGEPHPGTAAFTPRPDFAPKPAKRAPARRVQEIKHGTAYGYQRGCRKDDPCPAPDGVTCYEAYREYQNDYAARRRENAGKTLGSIKGLPKGTRKTPTTVSDVPVLPAGFDPALHGTVKGYRKGCRLKGLCPGVESVGRSCTQAIAEYQHEVTHRPVPDARDARIAELEALVARAEAPGTGRHRAEVA